MLTFAALCIAQVWIWDVTLRLDQARANAAENAVLRERLRFAGDLHDIQGHQLQAIALKAQLAARLIGRRRRGRARARQRRPRRWRWRRWPRRASSSRATGASGLATELANAVGILRAAGVDAAVEGTPEAVPVALQPLFGSLVREGATNLLRHTRAERCEIAVRARGRRGRGAGRRRRRGARGRADGDGSGVAGLRERFAAVGGRVEAAPLAAGGFVLSGRAPHRT